MLTTDLLRNKDAWAAGVKELRAMFASIELQGFGGSVQGAWRLHVDYQLYKALQVQYRQVGPLGEFWGSALIVADEAGCVLLYAPRHACTDTQSPPFLGIGQHYPGAMPPQGAVDVDQGCAAV